MRDLVEKISFWCEQGQAVALATVVKVYGSAPRPLGSHMIVSAAAEMAGSVSGGCVESAVVQEALAVIAANQARLIPFGIADAWAQSVGLACGGGIEVFVEPLACGELLTALRQGVQQETVLARITLLNGAEAGRSLLLWPDGRSLGGLGQAELDRQAQAVAREYLAAQRHDRRTLTVAGTDYDLFFEVFTPPPHLIIVGAVHLAIPLVTFANVLGFRTTVIDPRGVFASAARFAHAGQVLQRWPDEALAALPLHEATYIAVISHDDKLDLPALRVALGSRARYIGALGSQQTMAQRAVQLRQEGVTEAQLARIHNPIGLALGGRSPEEIALAIMAEIVAVRAGKELPSPAPLPH